MPAKRRSFAAVVRAAEGSLRVARVGHVFVGGLAVAAFGVPRTTTDVDVIVDYREQDAPRLAESFRRRGFESARKSCEMPMPREPTARSMTPSPLSAWTSLPRRGPGQGMQSDIR